MNNKMVIQFKLSSERYGFLSNFYKKQFKDEANTGQIKWKTSEHYYQWLKLKYLQDIGEPVDESDLQEIIDATTPIKAKKLGHKKRNGIEQWDEIKVEMMMQVLRAKFKYVLFRDALIATDNNIIEENSYYDLYWGNGGTKGNGLNMLGKCLMQLREELKNN